MEGHYTCCSYIRTLREFPDIKIKPSRHIPYTAMQNGHFECLKILIEEKKIKPNQKDDSGFTPLHFAAMFENIEAMDYLISQGAKVNSVNRLDNTPFHDLTKECGEGEGYKGSIFLISKGAYPKKRNLDGKTPLCYLDEPTRNAVKEFIKSRKLSEADKEPDCG